MGLRRKSDKWGAKNVQDTFRTSLFSFYFTKPHEPSWFLRWYAESESQCGCMFRTRWDGGNNRLGKLLLEKHLIGMNRWKKKFVMWWWLSMKGASSKDSILYKQGQKEGHHFVKHMSRQFATFCILLCICFAQWPGFLGIPDAIGSYVK